MPKRVFMRPLTAMLVSAVLLISPAHADEDAELQLREPGLGPALAAALPGLIVHGAGHVAAGEDDTGRRLATIEGGAVAGVLASALPLLLTGASRYVSPAAVPVFVTSTGVFVHSWFADIYGASGAGERVGGNLDESEVASLHLGYAFVRDVQFDYHNFATAEMAFRGNGFWFDASAWSALDHDNQRPRLEAAWRALGTVRGVAGSFLDAGGAATLHRFGDERFSVWTGEVFISGRLDLETIGPTLRGAFSELLLGVAAAWTHFRLDSVDDAVDVNALLLNRAAFGFYFGGAETVSGEVAIVYDHRRDGFSGALSLPNQGSGFLGSVGLRGRIRLGQNWDLIANYVHGSAQVMSFSVGRRFGVVP